MRGIIAHYTMFDEKRRDVLRVVKEKGVLKDMETDLGTLGIEAPQLQELLRDMVRNNILYFDPAEAVYYPQSRSYQWGIKLYFGD
jgi:hypothetical protein